MVQGIPALLATLGALAATGLLILRAKKERLPYLIAWCLTMGGISVALIGMTLGFLVGFGGFLFRLMEVGGALIAPVWLALGMTVLIAGVMQLRFACWLFGTSYSVVAVVILLLDPLKGSFDKSLPNPGRHYDSLPLLLIDVAHGVAVIALVACLVVIALRAGKQDRAAYELLMPVALVALAGVLVVSGTRGFLPGFLSALALAGAAGLVWFGVTRMLPETGTDEDGYDEEYQEGEYDGEYAAGYDDGYHDRAPADQGYEIPTGYDEQPYADPAATQVQPPAHARPPVPPQAKQPPPPAMPPAMPAGARLPAGERPGTPLCGQITVYTLMDGRGEAFDRLAAEAVRAAREAEPDILIFTCHEVPGAPSQRIVYRLFRDQAAFAEHQRLPHVQRFAAESRPYVAATNVIELSLTAGKVVSLPAPTVQDYP
ncbi:Quinol monooxygenase YgiN [Thermomonospora echinospora]|uniref:Quinol monooxygenase YgiN n=1 Tax=Thermomonospora echinospora TaxID=1992 RepID=A0A1H5YZR7_9ACTN|nr:antibiotic biosynthesis monooxygenase [Thermomonospora echinospora]SEG29270.1 Quinol monooxygenase YgiN [Thermomonospora echinospora]